jgi:hypothetical protein
VQAVREMQAVRELDVIVNVKETGLLRIRGSACRRGHRGSVPWAKGSVLEYHEAMRSRLGLGLVSLQL